jgi:hypothetical protein
MTFLMKTSKTKKFVKIFLRGILIIKKYFPSTIQDLFHFYKKKAFKIPKYSED